MNVNRFQANLLFSCSRKRLMVFFWLMVVFFIEWRFQQESDPSKD